MQRTVEVPYVAPVPSGCEVVVMWTEERAVFGGWAPAAPLVLDATNAVLYGPAWTPSTMHAGNLALDLATTGHRYAPSRAHLRGRVTSCLVVSRGDGKFNHLRTVIGLEATAGT